jgi:galactokinase
MNNHILEKIRLGFTSEYGKAPEVISRAPGRLEILGNHTDYNEGVVLSTAVDRATYVALAKRPGTMCRVKDLRDGSSRAFDLEKLNEPTPGDWANYIKGVIVALGERGVKCPAFDAVILSTIPMSAGMSSSAALEIAVVYALQQLGKVFLPWVELARIGQECENRYVGANTGLMDQFSSIRGKAGHLVFSDFRSLEVKNVPVPAGTALVVANSMVKHNLTGEYNERRTRCEDAVRFLQEKGEKVTALRDATTEMLNRWRDQMDIVTYRRALHVVGENERVFAGSAHLENNDLEAFGQLLFDSHESSRVNFENSCEELDILVELGRSLPGCLGARLSGGGFGGISVHLVLEEEAENYCKRLAVAYESRTGKVPETMICQPGAGAEVLV